MRSLTPFPTYLFRRVTSSTQFFPEIDGLRAVAILAVVAFHVSGYFWVKNLDRGAYGSLTGAAEQTIHWTLSHGFLGVQLFFVISGLVVSLPFARQARGSGGAVRLRDYFVRRLTRIEPPYFIALCAYATLALVVTPDSFRPLEYLAGFVYARNGFFHGEPWLFFVSWSLEIEVQFYLIAPLLALVFRVPSTTLRRVMLVAAIVASGLYAASHRMGSAEPPPFGGPLQHGWWLGTEIAFFLVGMLVADIVADERPMTRSRLRALAWDLAWILGLVAVILSYRILESSANGMLLLIAGLFVLTLGAGRALVIRSMLSLPLSCTIGGACYTIYLFHTPLVSLVGRFLVPATGDSYMLDMATVALPMTAGIVLACLALFPFVERPFMYREWPQVVSEAVRSRNPRVLAALMTPRGGVAHKPSRAH